MVHGAWHAWRLAHGARWLVDSVIELVSWLVGLVGWLVAIILT
jgi:hypothetical protein